jgi:uncharacterized membrane protein
MNDQTIILILRLFHITCGAFWAGSMIYLALFIIPALKASGPAGTTFMLQLGKTGYPIVIMIIAIVTIVTGIGLIWKLSEGFEAAWFHTPYARVLSMGMVLSLIAFVIGISVNRPAAMRINKVSDAIARAGGPPTNEQMNELMALRKKIFTGTHYIAVLLALTVVSMAICRYVG